MSRTDDTYDVVEFDFVDVADLRLASDASGRVVEAVESRAQAGSRTGLVQVDEPGTDAVAPLSPGIRRCLDRGYAELVLPHQQVRADTIVVWQPELLSYLRDAVAIQTNHVVVERGAADQRDQDGADEVRQACEKLFGSQPELVFTLSEQAQQGEDSRSAAASEGGERTVLMVSSNGTGMGHLTRLLAYARRAPGGVRPRFLSLSEAVPVVGEFGFGYEYVPSAAPTGMVPARWRNYLGQRLTEAIERLDPATVVFDGAWAYEAIDDVRRKFPGVHWIWSRRGMWYRGMNRDQLAKSAWFDAVLEPGDFAFPADPGVTAKEKAVRVGPVTLFDRDELLDRDDARTALNLDPTAPTALVTLGAGNINDASSAIQVVIEALRGLRMEICVTVPAIAERAGIQDQQVRLVNAYPLSRYLHAFDVAVSAAGYNSFHENLRFGVPTLFLPNVDTSLDDQRTRARYAAEQGWAKCLDKPEPDDVHKALEDLKDQGEKMASKVADLDPGNGAASAMDLIVDTAEGGADVR